jgi:hypothetical protein
MNFGRRSWAASIVGFALAVLAACAALQWAAQLLLQALPVLLPAAGVVLLGFFAWRYYNRPRGW